MKRLFVAITAAGGLAIGLAAAISGPAQATSRPHTTPTLALSKSSNLVAGQNVVFSGAGWTPSTTSKSQAVVVAECNSDGANGNRVRE